MFVLFEVRLQNIDESSAGVANWFTICSVVLFSVSGDNRDFPRQGGEQGVLQLLLADIPGAPGK